jgi:glycosyltransferase involved in cell wall biosynthesis
MIKLKSLSIKYNLEQNIAFIGDIWDDIILSKYFLISDLLVSPGNVGLNCIHAMSFGVPVLTHNNFSYQNPEVEAIVDGKNGFFYTYNDIEDLKLKVVEWFSIDRVYAKEYCIKIIEERFNPTNHAKLINKGVLNIMKL